MHTFVSRRGSVCRVCIDVRLSRKCARKDLVIGSECRPPGRWPDQSIQAPVLIRRTHRNSREITPTSSRLLIQVAANDSFRAAKHREVISRCLDAKCWRACSLLKAQFFPHVHLRSSVFERNFVHGNFHQMDPTPAFRAEILNRQGIGYLIRIESSSLIRNDNEDFPAGFAAAMNMNQLASLQAIAVDLKNSARKRSPTPFSLGIEL